MTRTRSLTLAALAAVFALLVVVPAHTQPTSIVVDGNIIKGYITTMASPQYLGRKSLTPGYENIAVWAAGKFKEWGLQPAGDNGTFLQAVPITGARSEFYWTTGTPSLVIGGRAFYITDGDFTVHPHSTPGKGVVGDVVFVGYGLSAPAKGLDEYAGVDVKGKVVLVLKGSPTNAPAPRGMGMGGPPPAAAAQKPAEPDPWASEATDAAKIKTAYDKGAAAILLFDPDSLTTQAAGRGGAAAPAAAAAVAGGAPQRPAVEPSPYTRPFIIVSNVSDRVFRWVMSRDPQETVRGFGVRLGQMRADIKNKKVRSAATGLKAQVKAFDSVTVYGEKFKNNISHNVIAKIDGSDPVLKSQYVIIGGHLDHLGVTNGVIANGADDNASGSAVTMEVARLLAVNKVPLKRTVVFALWCGEELGLLGSNYFVSNPPAGIAIDNVVTYFNMDMVGLGNRIGAPGALNFPTIFDVIKRDQKPEVIGVVDASTGGPGGSDHSAFIERGIEALALMTSGGIGHPDYHDAADDAAKIQPEILAKTGQFVLQGTINLANETSVNLLIPDRLHLYNAMRLTIPDYSPGPNSRLAVIQAGTRDELIRLANERVAELRRQLAGGTAAATPVMAAGGGRGGAAASPLSPGIRDVSVFGGEIRLIETAATVLGARRVDVSLQDGVWFRGGLTDAGKAALKAMEAAGVAVHLINPSPALLAGVLDAATRPVVVSGEVALTSDMVAKMKAKSGLLIVSCVVGDPKGCVAKLEAARKTLGTSDNLLLSMTTGPKLDEAKRELYLSLIKNGWTRDQIYAMAGATVAGRPGGNLQKLMPAGVGGGRGGQ